MTEPQDFLAWVCDPARTNDELFTVEILIEGARGGTDWPFSHVDGSYDARMERARERKFNPAHRPALHRDELKALMARAETVTNFSGAYMDSRPLRNLEALRFFPALTQVSVQKSDVTDFSPLAALRKVQYLSIAEYGDFNGCHPVSLAQCGAMPELQRLHLALRHPWPDLRGMAAWPALIDIRLNANVLALEGVTELPAMRVAHLKHWGHQSVELRDLRRLPLLPKARQLVLDATSSLEGIERYPSVVNLEVAGCFRDLTPLAAMENITAVTLIGERFQDLRPLAGMAKLREVKFVREFPLDLSPLAECPQLRRVEYDHCAMMRTEVSALNAGLLPEALDFAAEQPRPLGPLKFYRYSDDEDRGAAQFFSSREAETDAVREKFYDGDEVFKNAERRVFCTVMQAKYDQLLGRGWGIFRAPFVTIRRYPDTLRLVELVEMVRQYSAQSRFPLHVTFIVEPHGDMSEDLEEMRAREMKTSEPDADYLIKYYEQENVLEENEEGRRHREERYELLKREHLLRLRGEEEAELLYLAKGEPEPDEPAPEEEIEEPLSPEDDGEGGVAIAPPPTPPPSAAVEQLSDQLMFYLFVYEDCATTNSHWAERAQYHLGVPFPVWPGAEAKEA